MPNHPSRITFHVSRFTTTERLALLGILILAGYLRLNHLGWTEFKLDEANLSRLSLNLARGVEFPLTGIGSSTGIPNLPLAAWLLAIPYAISPSPIVATGFVAALNVIAVAGCYGLARRWLSASGDTLVAGVSNHVEGVSKHRQSASGDASYKMAALLATLLFAAAPWAVIHSRKIWAQNLLPPFVIAWAWSGWLAFVQRRPRALIGHALALAACVQLHYSGLYLIPVTLAWAIAFARRLRWKFALVAVALFAVTFAPFLAADVLHGGPGIGRILGIAGQSAVVDDQALRLAWLTITGQEVHSLAGPDEFENFLTSVPGGEPGFALGAVIGVLVVAAALAALIEVARAARRRSFDDRAAASLMLLTWLGLPTLLQSRHSLPLYPHYFIILYPVPFLFIGRVVSRLDSTLFERRAAPGKILRGAVIGLVVGIALLQSTQSIALQTFVASRATPGGFGVPIETTIHIADEAIAAIQAGSGSEALIYSEGDNPPSERRLQSAIGSSEVLIYSEGDNPFTHEGPAVFDVLLPPNLPRRFVDLSQATEVYPRGAAALVVYSPAGLALPDALIERSPLYRPEAVIPLRLGEGAAEVRAWPGQAQAATPCGGSTPIGQWQNGVRLLDAQPSGAWQGAGGWIELCYQVSAPPGDVDLHWFNHVIGPDGQRWAQVDGVGYRAASWRPGDVLVVRFGPFILPADAPPGRYTARIGMYTYPEIVNVPQIDTAGNPVGDGVSVELGELTR